MRLERHVDLPADVETVYAIYTDVGFQEETCAATSTGKYAATVTEEAGGAVVRTERTLPTDDLPDVAKGFVGAEILVVEVTRWAAAAADGSRTGTFELHLSGVPMRLGGRIALAPAPSSCTLDIAGDLKASVPLIGGKMERAAAEPILAALGIQLDLLKARIAAS